ncbi:MAG: feruloyl-CoA synthase [Hydrogenophaga sp.]|uniref:feruloyl-CoA synthase n=1 Tax=Hydrogenophaga sp. TaxID=1904254 RepID=UPI0027370EEE|nr:feruloyl-CoA synthase [Hydrogenophaga sp.]MDP3627815.1 feruloyl-CoA synthase [Hydrogenophaga sp.]
MMAPDTPPVQTTKSSAEVRYRPFTFGVTRALRHDAPGCTYLRADQPLLPYAGRITDKLVHWAREKPEHTVYARREPAQGGPWKHLSFAAALDAARRIGQALLDQGLSAERPLVILSENSLEHAMLALGAMYAGVPFCAVSPAYSLVSKDYDKLRHVLDTLTPGMVYANDWTHYGPAITATVPADTAVVLHHVDGTPTRPVIPLSALLQTDATPAVDAAMQATGPDTIVKFLFTSGSTKLPKAVINTHRMICANQQQMLQSMPTIGEAPLVLMDWMPWNHTAGGNHNFFMVISHGGTLYIDDGKPTPALLEQTLHNLREIAPTWYFNVPVGFEAIATAMKTDDVLRRTFLSRVRQLFYAGASLSQPVWNALYECCEREYGERVVMTAGLGMTESGPFGLFVTTPHSKSGDLGLPCAGLELKLVPMGDKTEIRYRGPNITPGYWRNEEATRESFDEEGFFCTGDAVQWIDPADIHQGLRFDGRIAEDFKLATGTFVSVGPLRARIIAAGAPYVQDAVLTGLDLKEVGAMLVPTPALRTLSGLAPDATMQDVVASAPVRAWLQDLLNRLITGSTGSANRIARALILVDPPSIDKGEITDKGSINQRAVLKHRDALVRALHEGSAPGILTPQT